MIRTLSTMIAAAVTVGALTAQIGCRSHAALPETTADPYAGPPLALDTSQAEYTVVVQAPSPGWQVSLDRVAEQYRHHAVFVSLRRPNPGYLYPQVIVDQRIATNVATTGPVKVYARTLDPDTRQAKGAYVLAAQSDGTLKRR
jgi:hypothetical protein